MKYIYTLLVASILMSNAMAQNGPISDEIITPTSKIFFDVSFTGQNNHIITTCLIIEGKKIKQIDVISKDQIKRDYKTSDADIMLKLVIDPIVLMNLNDIFEKYHIDNRYRNFKVLENNLEILHPETIIADPAYINKVVVNTDKKFINIILLNYDIEINHDKQIKIENQKMRDEYKRRHPN